MLRQFLILFLKGIPIGISNTLPGISGGTVALVLRIYDELIEAIKLLRLRFFVPLGLGAVTGLLGTAKAVTYLLDNHQGFIVAFIFGLILGSTVITAREIKRVTIIRVVSFMIGLGIVLFLSSQAITSVTGTAAPSVFKLVISGVLGAICMLLPGISGATVLILIGMYNYMLEALMRPDFFVIGVFCVSALGGLVCLSWILSYVLKNYRSVLMAGLTGLIIGSAYAVVPQSFSPGEIFGIILGIFLVILPDRIKRTDA
ncbi:MAG: DUF368 domain-containing protein [Syntrophomonadaceae bacterium]